MPTSPARIAANQQNAQRSTGPRTEEGKARSRLNALRHGMAGTGDLVGPDEDHALIDQRTQAFARELAAPGTLGGLFARRAAVLSVRMEQASDREIKSVAASAQAGRDQFDDDRAETLDAWLFEAEESAEPGPALRRLEATPEGVRHLGEVWRSIRSLVVSDDAEAIDRATLWLGLKQTGATTSAQIPAAIDAEIARLDGLADSPVIREAARRIGILRENAGKIAGFDPSPEASLARRYEAAAERGMYRAIRAIHDLRRDPSTASLIPAPVPIPPTSVPVPVPISPPARIVLPPMNPVLGSFGAEPAMVSAGRDASAVAPLTAAQGRPDPRKLAVDRP